MGQQLLAARRFESATALQSVERRLKNLAKFPVFYGGILFEQCVRYRRGIVASDAHLILSDRYVYDLEIPFSRRYVRAGRGVRRLIYRWFPAPDLMIHLQGTPAEVRARKDELEETQVERFEAIYREVLAGRRVVRIRVDASADELALRIVDGHWKEILGACWHHAPSNVLSRGRRRTEFV